MPADTQPRAPFDWRAAIANLPPWAHAVYMVALLLLGAGGHSACRHEPEPKVIVVPQGEPAPALVGADTETRPRLMPGHRLIAGAMRNRVSERLQRDGFALAGGDATPLTEARADHLARKLTDEAVYVGGGEVGVWQSVGDGERGGLIAWIRSLIQWAREHPEEVERWLRFLLTLLMAFV